MQKFNPTINNIYAMTEKQEIELWNTSIFIFDTSALLQFYYYSESAKKSIFDTTFEKLKGRLWLPFHVAHEFTKNREATSQKPYSEKYIPLETELKQLNNEIEATGRKVDDFHNKVKIPDTHPFIDVAIVETFITQVRDFKKSFQEFSDKVTQQFSERKNEIMSVSSNDIVLAAIQQYFDMGEPYNFQELIELIEDGELRYRNQIPPGYKDADDKEKIGTQKYGDLIIWRQILDYAKKEKKPVILICNDVKEDWAIREKHSSEKRIDGPRFELIKEINDYADVRFWMYTFSQFLYKAKDLLNTQIDEKVLKEVEMVSITETPEKECEDQEPEFRVITEEQLIDELVKFNKLISDNPRAYIGLKLFVHEVLGVQGFEINHSYAILNDLDRRGLIKICDRVTGTRVNKAISLN